MRAGLLVSALLHGGVIAMLLAGLPHSLQEPDEPPGLEVLLGARQAPAQGAAGDPALAPAEDPPGIQAMAAPPDAAPAPPRSAVAERPPASDPPDQRPPDPGPTDPAAMLPPVPDPPRVAELPSPQPPPPPPPPARPAPARAAAPPRPAAPQAEAPVIRPLFRDSLAALMPGAPGTGTEGELIPVREAPGIRNPLPIYPEAARQRGQQGSVGVRLRVDADGTVLRVEIVESSGHPLLDQAVVEALRRWRFAPAMQGGRPVAADFLHRTTFRLD